MPVKNQIKFLNLVAKELPDPFLGIHLAESIELREMGFVYYVIASSETLGDALRRLARYSGITNEGVRITCDQGKVQRTEAATICWSGKFDGRGLTASIRYFRSG